MIPSKRDLYLKFDMSDKRKEFDAAVFEFCREAIFDSFP